MRNEQNDRSSEKRESQKREQPKQQPSQSIGHTPDKAEGDEKTVDEALRNDEKRR